jgi:excisionase family DNA binding protein
MNIDKTNIVYTLDEVCFIFRIGKRKLKELIRKGEIKAISFSKRHCVIPRSEVERWLGQDLRFVDLAGMGKSPSKPKKTRNALRFLKLK